MKTVSASRPGVAVFSSTASVLYYVHCAVRVIFSCTCQYTNGSEAVCVVANRELPKRTLLFQVLSLEGRPPSVTRARNRKQYVYPPTKTMVHRDRFARCPAAIALARRSSVSFSHAVRTRHGRSDGRSDERASERTGASRGRSTTEANESHSG